MKTVILSLLAALAIAGCDHPPPTVTITETASVSPQDFALDTVVGLLRSGVNDGATLEAKVNDPASGINNVDLDKDGKVDFVQVVESQIPDGKKMELVAHASGGQAPDTSIAAIKFAQGGSGVDVQAGYAPLVDPTGRFYYHDTLGSDLLFAQWLFLSSRPVYFAPVPMGYAYRSRMPTSTFSQTRTTFTTTTRVSPVAAAPRPTSFNAARLTSPPKRSPPTSLGQASQGTSNFAADSRSKPTSLGQASQGTSNFAADSRSKPAAVGFGASTSKPSTLSAPRSSPAPAPRPASRPSSPSRGRSR